MKKYISLMVLCAAPFLANGQAAFDALQMSQNDLRGTSRFQSMAGAFGALGGDISVLNQNPAGIGVYRSSDASVTLDLDFQSSKVDGMSSANTQTKFNLNNVGYVGAIKLNSETMPNLNFGFSFNRSKSFHRRYTGGMNNIKSSVSDYVAALTNAGNWSKDDLSSGYVGHPSGKDYDPYYDSYAPWLSILFYKSYLINPTGNGFEGLSGGNATGIAEFEVDESGHTDEYSINLGGNVKNTVYWGLGVGIVDLKYDSYMYYGEALNDAFYYHPDFDASGNELPTGRYTTGEADFGLVNHLSTKGTGYNFKFGVIVKPVNELRLGLAFHTPTYFELKDLYKTISSFEMTDTYGSFGTTDEHGVDHPLETGVNGYWDEYRYNLHTPWRFIGSIAGVIGQKGILSLDYEWKGTNTMRLCDDHNDEFVDMTTDIKNYFQPTHTIRVGGEYRVDNHWSLRAGYSYTTSPVKDDVKNGVLSVTTTGSNTAYQYDRSNQYITCGFGYRYKAFYLDMAYVHNYRQSNYHAYPAVTYSIGGTDFGNYAAVNDHNNRVSLTMGFRF